LHAIKCDGYRMQLPLCRRQSPAARTGPDWSKQYGFTIEALQSLPVKSAYLDGKLSAIGPDGVPTCSRRQETGGRGRSGGANVGAETCRRPASQVVGAICQRFPGLTG
jgi:bifunctional non-homologous end joining protein LigD